MPPRPAARIVTPDDRGLTQAADLLRGGALVGMPTETVYGLACDATNPVAVAEVFDAKARPSFDPLIVHAADTDAAFRLAASVPGIARDLAAAFWPGPLTLVLPKTGRVGDLVTSGLTTVALRVPGHKVARALIDAAGVPLAAPSANRFGRVSPTTAQHVVDELGDAVDLVLDGGPCATGVESTVVAFDEAGCAHVLRLGGVTVESLREIAGAGCVKIATADAGALGHAPQHPRSPGMLNRHYAPRTPLTLLESGEPGSPDPDAGLLIFDRVPAAADAWGAVEVLSPDGDLRRAAANLFAAMRRLDAAGVTHIIACPAPDHGLGRAINDRLRRAATRDA